MFRHAAQTRPSSAIAGSTRGASTRSTTTPSCTAVAPALLPRAAAAGERLAALDPDAIHVPGIYIKRLVCGAPYDKRIEFRTVRDREVA